MPTTTQGQILQTESGEASSPIACAEGIEPQSEQRWRQPIPQKHHHSAANRGKTTNPQIASGAIIISLVSLVILINPRSCFGLLTYRKLVVKSAIVRADAASA